MTNFKKNAITTAVMAFCALGSSHAADWADGDLTVTENKEYGKITMESSQLTNSGELVADNISVNGGGFSNTGKVTANSIDIRANTSGTGKSLKLKGDIIAKDSFIYRGAGHNQYGTLLEAKLTTQHFIIDSHDALEGQVGLHIESNEVLANVGKISVIGAVSKTGLGIGTTRNEGTEDIKINAPIYLDGTDGDARIEVYKGWVLDAGHVTAIGQGKSKLQANAGSVVKVDTVEVAENGKLTLQSSNGEYEDESKFIVDSIVVNDGASLVAKAGGTWIKPQVIINSEGSALNVTMGTDSKVDFGGTDFDADKPAADSPKGESIKITAQSIAITVDTVNPESASFILPNVEGNVTAKPENITVTATGVANTGNSQADLAKLVDVVTYSSRVGDTGELDTKAASGIQITQEANDIFDGSSATVTTNERGEAVVDGATIKITENSQVYGIAEMAAVGLSIWRNEINDMNKRLGELRDSSSDANGVWARVYNGKAEYGALSVTNEYTALQFGYDRQVKPGFWLGGAFSYTDGDNDFTKGGGESSIFAFTGYGSWLAENGMFLDVTGKVGRIENEFDIATTSDLSSGSYDTNTFSVSAEAGWRFYPMHGNLFVEPQVEMMWGRVNSADYTTSTGVDVNQSSAEVLIGRAGFVLGLKCPEDRGNAYIRASVLHDWKGEADFSYSKDGQGRKLSEDLGGTWYEYGIGANYNATKNVHVYADVEAANGGEVDTDYRVNLGVRYSF